MHIIDNNDNTFGDIKSEIIWKNQFAFDCSLYFISSTFLINTHSNYKIFIDIDWVHFAINQSGLAAFTLATKKDIDSITKQKIK
jgi:hypothetical protein